jgi:methionyl aminopeptidase
MGLFGRERLRGRTPDQLRVMREAGLLVARTLELVVAAARPGATTLELDTLAEAHIRDHGGVPNFQLVPGYSHTLCTSVNEEIVHGIPGGRVLREGDLLSVDCGAEVEGWNGDAAVSLVVGGPDVARPEDLALVEDTEAALWAGIAALRVGSGLYAVGAAVEDSLAAAGERRGRTYGIVEDYVGHGIGRAMHEDPQVPNYRVAGRGPTVVEGSTLAIEPMVTLGNQANRVLDDGWTVVTTDGARAAHWEHSVAATTSGLWVLTAPDGGAARLARLGVPCAEPAEGRTPPGG